MPHPEVHHAVPSAHDADDAAGHDDGVVGRLKDGLEWEKKEIGQQVKGSEQGAINLPPIELPAEGFLRPSTEGGSAPSLSMGAAAHEAPPPERDNYRPNYPPHHGE